MSISKQNKTRKLKDNRIASNHKYTHEWAYSEAKQYSTRQEFRKNRIGLYMYAYRYKILDSVCAHMPPPRKLSPKYDISTVQSIAANYKVKSEFRSKERGAYNFCYKNNLLTEVCKHMKTTQKWNNESAALEAKKYRTRRAFKDKSAGAYRYCARHNLLDKVCMHMKRGDKNV